MSSHKSRRCSDVDILTISFSNLDETTKNIFKENVRVTQALSYHVEEADELRKRVTKLERENEQLRGNQELNEMLVQQKVSQSQKNKQTIKEVYNYMATRCGKKTNQIDWIKIFACFVVLYYFSWT